MMVVDITCLGYILSLYNNYAIKQATVEYKLFNSLTNFFFRI